MHQPIEPTPFDPDIKIELTDKATPGDRFILATIWLLLKDRNKDDRGIKRIALDDWVGGLQDLDCLPDDIKEDVKILGVQGVLTLAQPPDPIIWGVENGEIFMTLQGQVLGCLSAVSLKFITI